jgi:hypothetical protein
MVPIEDYYNEHYGRNDNGNGIIAYVIHGFKNG